MTDKITANKVVTLAYVLRDDTGEIIDRSQDGSPLLYLHGAMNIVPGLEEQLTRETRPLPRLEIDETIRDLDDIEPLLSLDTDEIMAKFRLTGYAPHPPISFKVAV